MNTSTPERRHHSQRAWILCFCTLVTLYAAIVPSVRAFLRVEINYNEGWNIYNAVAIEQHRLLYPTRYGWTMVNYPMLSFVVMAALHHLTHDYLFTARALSLLSLFCSSFLVGLVVMKLTRSSYASILAGLFCFAVFCADANYYVGMDDPQMFAQVLFLSGLVVYISKRHNRVSLVLVALLFAIGGCIKHNLIDFPIAIAIDLLLASAINALLFVVAGTIFTAIALGLHYVYGGSYLIDQLLAPREFSGIKAFEQLLVVLGPILMPVCLACWAAWFVRKDAQKRVACILFGLTITVGGYFGGGHGVSINALFGALLAISMLMGLLIASPGMIKVRPRFESLLTYTPVAIFAWLLIPLALSGNINPVRSLRQAQLAEKRFDRQVVMMKSAQGPALCESLLRCYLSGKPYLYDPFNATRLIRFGKLDVSVLISDIRLHKYSLVQLDSAPSSEPDLERFDPRTMDAIRREYHLVFLDEDVEIYAP